MFKEMFEATASYKVVIDKGGLFDKNPEKAIKQANEEYGSDSILSYKMNTTKIVDIILDKMGNDNKEEIFKFLGVEL